MADKHLDSAGGRDGISGVLSPDRALRAREVEQRDAGAPVPPVPPADEGTVLDADDEFVIDALVARASGRRPRPHRRTL